MTTKEVKKTLDRVLTWPKERQERVMDAIELLEAEGMGRPRLTKEQAAEVRRRLREKNPKTVSFAAFERRLRKRYGA